MSVSPRSRPWNNLVVVVNGWPRLFTSLGIAGVVFLVALAFGATILKGLLIAWDVGVLFFLIAATLLLNSETSDIRARAGRQDVGERVILSFTALAALASVGAIYGELSIGTASAAWPIALAVATFILSWLFIHAFFAFHYAHEYYGHGDGTKSGGLAFPGEPAEPDYWDFFYFAIVIGMTSQVSDVAITDRGIRRTVTAHALIAFFFNVALLALIVNVASDAIRRQDPAPATSALTAP